MHESNISRGVLNLVIGPHQGLTSSPQRMVGEECLWKLRSLIRMSNRHFFMPQRPLCPALPYEHSERWIQRGLLNWQNLLTLPKVKSQ